MPLPRDSPKRVGVIEECLLLSIHSTTLFMPLSLLCPFFKYSNTVLSFCKGVFFHIHSIHSICAYPLCGLFLVHPCDEAFDHIRYSTIPFFTFSIRTCTNHFKNLFISFIINTIQTTNIPTPLPESEILASTACLTRTHQSTLFCYCATPFIVIFADVPFIVCPKDPTASILC